MATFNKFNSFVEDVAEGVHNLGSDTLKIALTAAANAPAATNGQLSDLTTVSTTNLTGVTVTVSDSSQTAGTYKLTVTDFDLTASGGSCGPFRYVVLYNDTATNDELIGWWDYGSELTLSDGETLTLNFDDSNGVLQIA